jgi:hypothetical protein
VFEFESLCPAGVSSSAEEVVVVGFFDCGGFVVLGRGELVGVVAEEGAFPVEEAAAIGAFADGSGVGLTCCLSTQAEM